MRGRITIYDERGDLQMQAEMLEPKGAGALQLAFEQLKARLAAEGLFDAARKKPIPTLPKRIGVVTSARGAALHDILNILRRRHESVSVLIYDARVQGEAAAAEVSEGVRHFNRARNVDVIVVARGGGSLEDLFAFNDESLARTIAASKIPVISAVGHETDFTICDFVADLRAPTPSAAAELVIHSKQELAGKLAGLHDRLRQSIRHKLLRASHALERSDAAPGFRSHAGLGGSPPAARRRPRLSHGASAAPQACAVCGERTTYSTPACVTRTCASDWREMRRQLEQRGRELQTHHAPAADVESHTGRPTNRSTISRYGNDFVAASFAVGANRMATSPPSRPPRFSPAAMRWFSTPWKPGQGRCATQAPARPCAPNLAVANSPQK